MQPIITLDWPKFAAREVVRQKASATNKRADLLVSKVYKQHVNHLYNYGMNVFNDPALVKNCIVKCFLLLASQPEVLDQDQSDATNVFKTFRRLVNPKKDTNVCIPGTEMIGEFTTLQHEALFLKFQCKLTYREVADIMELPIEQLRTQISRAMSVLLQAGKELR